MTASSDEDSPGIDPKKLIDTSDMFLERNAACPIYCSIRHGYMTLINATCIKSCIDFQSISDKESYREKISLAQTELILVMQSNDNS